ncbi:LON peptidase N-terminal domain and RING finger protein 3-like [Dendronephthya gigantea]|uniref:LON peptidase N-terminal domain and RING finger protein 3-like n=1 Tax=Dendronephthya gigantea TaxID=151771 RepID=UPI00106BCF01|nr:LON peptidase N-terminal domain and RING finger protein 3-like [Dendronephthya gigantea]
MADLSHAEQYYNSGKYSEAYEIYDVLLNNEPQNVDLLLGKANCSTFLSKWHDSLENIEKAFVLTNLDSSIVKTFLNNLIKNISTKARLNEYKEEKNFEANLICEICYEVLCYPVTLLCGHTFCRQCVLRSKKCLFCSDHLLFEKSDNLSVNVVLTSITENCFQAKMKAFQLRCEGNDFFPHGQYEAALKKYTEALQLDPTNHLILGNLSHVCTALEDYEAALDYANRACNMSSTWEKGHYRKAQAHVGLKNYSQATVSYLKILLIDQQNDIARKSLEKVFVEILTNSINPGNSSTIDDLAASLDGLIEGHGDSEQKNIGCFEDVQSILSVKLGITDLECSLCCRMFYEPVTCPCGHTFCQWCLNRCLDHNPVCPVCRYSINEYINNEIQNITRSIQAVCKGYFPKKFEERKRQHEEEVARLASVASDTDEDIPIFVCTLAIPTIPCNLCIFEPRYRLMIRECMVSGSRQFGMCCPSEDNSFSDYGVMLEIEDFTLLPDGKSFVKSVGGRRFKVLSRGVKNGYNTAKVEWLKDKSFSEEEIEIIRNRQQYIYAKIVNWFSSMSIFEKIHLLAENQIPMHPPECDTENITNRNGPNWIWWSLHLLPMQPAMKLQIISMTNIRQRLDRIEQFFQNNT